MDKIAYLFRESRVARFFIPAGLILFIFGIVLFVISFKTQNYIKIESTISSVELAENAYTDSEGNYTEASYEVKVKYTVDGKEYEEDLGRFYKRNVGDKMTIYYNPDDPTQITQTKGMLIPLIVIALGIASLVGGIISASNAIKRYKKMKAQEEGWKNE